MKFREITFLNHPILGNLHLDFTDANGKAVETIILAGENGCGKTIILNSLFDFFNRRDGKAIEGVIELNSKEISAIKAKYNTPVAKKLNNDGDILTIKFSPDAYNPNLYNKDGHNIAASLILLNQDLNTLFGKVYSDVEINFTPQQIRSVTANDIDQCNSKSEKSNVNLATSITQLLVDIKALDDAEIADWVNSHTGEIPPEEIKNSRMKRFINAFHSIFPTKRFLGIENKSGEKVINFIEYNKVMTIDKLSSGEKQVVFRGSFLLKNKKSNEGAYILIDEPEISLHPKWQLEIMPFIKRLFTNEDGIQTSQIIVATHSPFIIHNSNRQNDKVVVLQKSDNGEIVVSQSPEFYSWGPMEIVKKAFNINVEFNKYERIVFVEGETDERYYNKALDVFGYDKNKIHIEWIGRNVEKGKSENTGDTALNNAAKFFKANMFMLKSKVILLYDCDTKKPEAEEAPLYVQTMTYNSCNNQYRIGIENLLVLPENFDYESFYSISEKSDDYGAVSIHRSLNKTKLCDTICNYSNDKLMAVLDNLKSEIDKIITI